MDSRPDPRPGLPPGSRPGPRHVAVIGAGIVGVCAALYLQRDGHRVTLFDPRGPGEGASKGNGAVLAVESCVPVATPGIVRRVPGMLLDPLGPLTIRWHHLPRLAPWLARFLLASRPGRVEAASIALRALLVRAIDAYRPLVEGAGVAEMIRRTGWLAVYESEASFARAQAELALQRRRGVPMDVLRPEEIRQLEPSLAPIYRRGVFFPENAYVLDNHRLVMALAEHFVRGGGTLLPEAVAGFNAVSEGTGAGPICVRTDVGQHTVNAVVVAAGAWSKDLARRLGHRVPLDTERGYHVTLPNPGVTLRLPIYSGDYSFVSTPLEHGLRFAGTVELGGLAAPPDYGRADVLLERGRRMFPGLNAAGATKWMGFRPSLPDSLPVIGSSTRHRNAFFAFGHGHLGLTLGAITGRLIADLVAGRDPGIDMTPYRVDRF